MKGGTSLSKGFGVIHRFSEDIDIRIEPPDGMNVKTGPNQDKPAHVASRRAYYDALAVRIKIPGVDDVVRDTLFDDDKMHSAGIRLNYVPRSAALVSVKEALDHEIMPYAAKHDFAVSFPFWGAKKAINIAKHGVSLAETEQVKSKR